MTGLLQLASDAVVLLAEEPKPKGAEFGKATPLGLAVIVVLLAVTFLLIRSMNKHIKNLPESFEDEAPGTGDEAGGTDHAGVASPPQRTVDDDGRSAPDPDTR